MPAGRILAVDDQRYFRELIEGLLAEEGYKVQTAASGEEALEILEHSVFDVVITDLVMPVMSGTDLVQRIKEEDPEQDIVVVTGVVDVKSAVDAMKIGAVDYLLKPFDRQTLSSSLSAILTQRRLRSERDRLLAENIEYLGERSLFERALALFGSESTDVLAQRVLDGLSAETGAQGAVLWLEEDETGATLRLLAARGLVRVEEERASLRVADLPTDLAQGRVASIQTDWEEQGLARPSLVVALRRSGRLVGLVRLTDKLGGDNFDEVDRGCVEKFIQFADRAFANAARIRILERRSLEDPDSGAYRMEVLDNAAHNEIERANRFGRTFGIVKLEVASLERIRTEMDDLTFLGWWNGLVQAVQRVLRATDLLAVDQDRALWILLAESDAIGTAIFKRRTRHALEACEALAAVPEGISAEIVIGAVTYPADATQLESLRRVLDDRVVEDGRSLERLRGFDRMTLAECLGELLEQGSPEPADAALSLVRFALAEVGRRPRDRNLFLFNAGSAFAEALDGLDTVRVGAQGTEIIVLADRPAPRSEESAVTWLPAARLGGCPPFLVHFGDGPPYVLVCAEKPDGEERVLFHTSEPALAEYLAFRLHRELRLPGPA